jgi:Zn-dependent peptidase ImmA (M78 family)
MIPRRFKLLNYTWIVVGHSGMIREGNRQLYGKCDHNEHVITLNIDAPAEVVWHTFLHELLHATLEAVGRTAFSADEDLVDSVSGALSQALPNPISKRKRTKRDGK